MDNIFLDAASIIKDYGTEPKIRALKGIDLKLERSEFASLIGPSGCGKSTLMNILGALDKPSSGTIIFGGVDLSTMNDRQLATFRNKSIGFVFQAHNLLPEFTALENVMIPSWIGSGVADSKMRERAVDLLEQVGLKDRINNQAFNLSGGQQQRVSIARALVNRPDLILADEPTGNLDSETSAQILELLRQINQSFGTSFLIITHDRHIAEKSDRVIEMLDGKIIDDYKTAGVEQTELWQHLAPCNCKCPGR